MDRRVFLKNGSLAMLSLGFAPAFLARTVAAADARRSVLITIFQRGAVDGLNMIVPFGERDYYAARPSIAIGRPRISVMPRARLGITIFGTLAIKPIVTAQPRAARI